MKTHSSMVDLEKSEIRSKSVTEENIFCVIFMFRRPYSMTGGDFEKSNNGYRTDPEEVEAGGQ